MMKPKKGDIIRICYISGPRFNKNGIYIIRIYKVFFNNSIYTLGFGISGKVLYSDNTLHREGYKSSESYQNSPQWFLFKEAEIINGYKGLNYNEIKLLEEL